VFGAGPTLEESEDEGLAAEAKAGRCAAVACVRQALPAASLAVHLQAELFATRQLACFHSIF
jgi:hypothetical protein